MDVFGYVPPDEDFNPQHPVTRTDCLRFRAACFRWARNNLGLVGTEAAADWVIPYVDFGSSNPGAVRAIPVPLYELVYHDAIVSPFDSRRPEEALRALLYGGVPSLPGASVGDEKMLASVRQVAALHQRIALLEMTNHEFLDGNYRRERTTFADGTTVTVDWDAGTVQIDPPRPRGHDTTRPGRSPGCSPVTPITRLCISATAGAKPVGRTRSPARPF